jgi:hypothetical protein
MLFAAMSTRFVAACNPARAELIPWIMLFPLRATLWLWEGTAAGANDIVANSRQMPANRRRFAVASGLTSNAAAC